MGFKCGIVGLPNVGKSTLFNALTETAAAQAANYPFCTIEPNVGEVSVPDPRLDDLARLGKSEKIVPTRLTFVDIAGLVRGASKGEGLGNQFLGNIREVDAIAHVVRCFEDTDVTHVEGKIDPIADIETIETELMLADLESLEKRVDALEKKARGNDKEAKELLDLVQRALKPLQDGKPARIVERKPEEEKAFAMLGLMTAKPVVYVCNVEEASAANGNDYSRKVEARAKEEGAVSVVISAKIESEIAVLLARRTGGLSRRGRPEGSRPRPADPRRLRVARPRHLFHRGAERGARLDHHARHQGAAGSGCHPLRFREGLHPGRDHRVRRLYFVQRRSRCEGGWKIPPGRQGIRRRRRRRVAFQICDVSFFSLPACGREKKASARPHLARHPD